MPYPESVSQVYCRIYSIVDYEKRQVHEIFTIKVYVVLNRIIAKCLDPYHQRFVTITFRSFTPTPGGLEFEPGKDYYFISTSSPDDLYNRIGGRCSTHSMKVIFKVINNLISQELGNTVNLETNKKHGNRKDRKQRRRKIRKKLLNKIINKGVSNKPIPISSIKHIKTMPYQKRGSYRHNPYMNNKYSNLRENELLKHEAISVEASRMLHSGSSYSYSFTRCEGYGQWIASILFHMTCIWII